MVEHQRQATHTPALDLNIQEAIQRPTLERFPQLSPPAEEGVALRSPEQACLVPFTRAQSPRQSCCFTKPREHVSEKNTPVVSAMTFQQQTQSYGAYGPFLSAGQHGADVDSGGRSSGRQD